LFVSLSIEYTNNPFAFTVKVTIYSKDILVKIEYEGILILRVWDSYLINSSVYSNLLHEHFYSSNVTLWWNKENNDKKDSIYF